MSSDGQSSSEILADWLYWMSNVWFVSSAKASKDFAARVHVVKLVRDQINLLQFGGGALEILGTDILEFSPQQQPERSFCVKRRAVVNLVEASYFDPDYQRALPQNKDACELFQCLSFSLAATLCMKMMTPEEQERLCTELVLARKGQGDAFFPRCHDDVKRAYMRNTYGDLQVIFRGMEPRRAYRILNQTYKPPQGGPEC